MLISDDAVIDAAELHSKLCEESALVLNQHNPPFWCPLRKTKTPMLWRGAEKDAVISLKGAKSSADFYGADFIEVKGAGHNLMMDRNRKETVLRIADWLA